MLASLLLVLALLAPVHGQALQALPRANVHYAVPIVGSSGTVETETIDGVDRLVLEEVPGGRDPRQDAVAGYLDKNPGWDLVRRLYAFAWKRTGQGGEGDLVLAVTDMFSSIGPSHAPYPVVVKRRDGSKLTAGSFIILSDIPSPPERQGTDLTLEILMRHDYLALALAHESAHQVMYDRYGPREFPKVLSLSKGGHETDEITDPYLAFSEGWAESFEAIVGDLLVDAGQAPQIDHPALKQLKQRRHEMIQRDRYIWEELTRKTGRVKSGMQLVSTEGVVAYLVFQSYAHRIFRQKGQPEAYGTVLDTLARHKPKNVVEFWNATMADAAAVKPQLVRIFLEGTQYATVSSEAPAKYFEMFRAAQASRKLPQGHPGKADAEKEMRELAASWKALKESLYKEATRTGRVDAGLPPGLDCLWVDKGLHYREGLNIGTADELADFHKALLPEAAEHLERASAWVARREERGGKGWLASVDALGSAATPDEMAALRKAREQFEKNRAEAESSRASRSGFGIEHLFQMYVKRCKTHAEHARIRHAITGK